MLGIIRKFCIFVSLGILFICPVFSQSKFSIKLTGGASTITGGDLNTDIREFHKFMSNLNQVPGYSASLDLNEMNYVFNFGGELVYQFNNNFGVGIGAEYLTRTAEGPAKIAYSDSNEYWWGTGFDVYDEVNTHSYTLKAIPILLNLYYWIPWGEKKSIFLNFGAGYYFGSFKHKSEFNGTSEYREESWYYWDYLYNYSYTGVNEDTTKTTTFGFHGGIGFDLNLTAHIGIIFEARGRIVNFKDWEGDQFYENSWEEYEWLETRERIFYDLGSWQEKETGKVWLISFTDKTTDSDYKQISLFDEKPEMSIRRAEIDLNGITFRAGIKIRF
jgi:hypothetical protein